jgi:prepilin-type N-terminal cleavage/methylation domain-containing protein
MRTSETGISNRLSYTDNNISTIWANKGRFHHPILSTANNKKGLTLFELLLVIAILGSILLIVFPKITLLEDFTLKSEARRMAGLFRYLHESTSTKKVYYRVWLYPERDSLKIESSIDGIEFREYQDTIIRGFSLRGGIDIQDIVIAGLGKVNKGAVAIVFNPQVGAEPFNLHLKGNEHTLTLKYNPYSGKVKVIEGYV